MAQPETVISQSGPLPITKQIQTGSTGPATLVIAGSVWSKTPNVEIGIEVSFDGVDIGASEVYSNGTETHRATVPVHLAVNLDKPFTGSPPTTPPVYTVELRPLNSNTESDVNDNFQVTLLQ